MVILVLNTFGENPSACLLVDGILTAFCQEERFTRLKISSGHFPAHSVKWCLGSQGPSLPAVDCIAVAWDCTKYPWRMLRRLAGLKLRLPSKVEADPWTERSGQPRVFPLVPSS